MPGRRRSCRTVSWEHLEPSRWTPPGTRIIVTRAASVRVNLTDITDQQRH
jgi:hypothetical protein